MRLLLPVAAALLLVVSAQVLAVDLGAEHWVIQQTNAFRKMQGRQSHTVDPALSRAADEFARYMARHGKYGHTADGRTPADRASAHGYDYCLVLENIAYVFRSAGYPSASALAHDMVEGWKKSPQHRDAMLDADATQTGVAIARAADGRYYGVQMFGRPKSASIRFSISNLAGTPVEYRAGERAYTLPPRTTREHTVCRPLTLNIAVAGGSAFNEKITDGIRYTVTKSGVQSAR